MLFPLTTALFAAGALSQAVAISLPSKRDIQIRQNAAQLAHLDRRKESNSSSSGSAQQVTQKYFKNPKAASFYVDGTKIPEVDFDVGPSWAGLLPISSKPDETRKLYFWYYPPSKHAPKVADKTLTFWTNGGPGCSSLEGISQENGPWTWPWGTYKPVENEWSWTNYSHVLWVEQPVGTGFSQGKPNLKDEVDLSRQLVGFFEQFLSVFSELKGKDFYVTGESYAGMYLPYIADYIYTNATSLPLNLKGLLVFDPSLGSVVVQEQIPALQFLKDNANVFALNASYTEELQKKSDACGYSNYSATNLKYPPAGGLLPYPGGTDDYTFECDLWNSIFNATLLVNPAFNVYRIFDVWPILWDILGFPGSFPNEQSKPLYFNRKDVKKAINAPIDTDWAECSNDPVFPNGDGSPYSAFTPLPRVIEKSERTIIAHGLADYILIAEGTRLIIQNMTWGGAQGFQSEPKADSFQLADYGGSVGVIHTERKLTYAEVKLSGHMIPQFVPWAAAKLLQQLLGQA